MGKRWGVEVAHRLMNRFKRMRWRVDTNDANYEAYIALACALITFRAASRALHHAY